LEGTVQTSRQDPVCFRESSRRQTLSSFPFGRRTSRGPDICPEFGILHFPQLCPYHGGLTLDRHRPLPRIRPRPGPGEAQPWERVAVFMRLMPRMTFLMPVLAGVTFTSALELTNRMGLPLDNPWIIAALVVTGILCIQGLQFFSK